MREWCVRLFLVLPLLQGKSCLHEARRHTPSNLPNHLLVTPVVNPWNDFGSGRANAGWTELHQFSSDFLAVTARDCCSARGNVGQSLSAPCCSRGTHRHTDTQLCDSGAPGWQEGMSDAPCWGVHTALPILWNETSEHSRAPSATCSSKMFQWWRRLPGTWHDSSH